MMEYIKENEISDATAFRAMGHPTRCWIVKELSKEEHCVGEFVKTVGVEFATMSRHLAKLRKSGILTYRKKGREIYYQLNRPRLNKLFEQFKAP